MVVLIADDNDISASIIELNLRDQKLETVRAATGLQALHCLESTPGIRLVITDIMMPEMDGLELLRRMKEAKEWKDIPVILCTALGDAEHVTRAARLGCRHYLVKPFEHGALMRKVREALKDEGTALRDRRVVMRRLGLSPRHYEEMLGKFASLVNEQIGHLEKAEDSTRLDAIRAAAAALSENAATLGAERLSAAFHRLEAQTADDRGQEISGSNYRTLVRELELLAEAIRGSVADTSAKPQDEPPEEEVRASGT